jgi:GGDEF domain-containing protein/CheY-like chemotaxis protein
MPDQLSKTKSFYSDDQVLETAEGGLPGWKAFQEALKQELAGVRGLKQKVTVLLIEVDGDNRPEACVVTAICDCLLDATRKRDSIYQVTHCRFAAILPGTHEAGGQTAALRVKKLISKKIVRGDGSAVTLSVGILSVDPQDATDLQKINEYLEKDLLLDRECQCLVLDKADRRSDLEGEVVILSDTSEQSEPLSSLLSSQGYNVFVTGDPGRALEILDDHRESVMVIGPGVLLERGVSFCKKCRLNRELNPIYIIWLHDNLEEDFRSLHLKRLVDESFSPAASVDSVASRIVSAFGTVRLRKLSSDKQKLLGILDSVGFASHQLNQPLQIILSKMEIMLLNMEEDAPESQALAEVRKQALRAADTNRKIARLIKSDIS